eukprot:5293319-Amphidinium_carterae.1
MEHYENASLSETRADIAPKAESVSGETCSTAASSLAPSTVRSDARASAGRVRLVECGPVMPHGGTGGPQPTRGRAGGKQNFVGWACTPTGQWMRVMSSTAVVANRERDKSRVESELGLKEFGDLTTEFYAAKCGFLPVAKGYSRIVYGDHGPYVELDPQNIVWETFPCYVPRPESCYFDEYWTADGSTMLYSQKRTVRNKPNPPSGPWAVHNNRSE